MAEVAQFSFDPRCPWCWQTSRWARRIGELGVVDWQWGVFCLELNGFDKPHDEFDPEQSRSAPALRIAVAVRESEGQAACGRFYAAIGTRYFDNIEDLAAEETLRGGLEDAGVDPGYYDKALSDPATWATVRAEHEQLVDDVKGFGVPTIRLDAGKGPAIFGPVISEPPPDDEAVELWQHSVWLVRNANFHELKRERTSAPNLPYIEKMRAERAAAQQKS